MVAATTFLCLAVVGAVIAVSTMAPDAGPTAAKDSTGSAARLAGNHELRSPVATESPRATTGSARSKSVQPKVAGPRAPKMHIVPGVLIKRLPPPEKHKKPKKSVVSTAPFDVRIGTFNVLGSQHTTPGGDRPNFPPASVRSAGAANLIAKHGVHVLGTQELQDDQLRALQARTGFAAYPGFSWGTVETDNSILYDPSLYEFVSGSQFTITFVGRPRPQPILRLRDRATGREFYVVNTHPSPGLGRALVERRNAQATVVAQIRELQATGLPVLTTGDMNDRAEFYCHVVTPAGMTSPNGGSTAGGCHPPPMPMPVDWVVGSGVTWSSYWRDVTSTAQRISDHIFVSALAHVE